jgi:hypothetical protein
VSSIFEQRAHKVLEILRAAGDRPVSSAELLAAGIRNPASVVYELEISGHAIEHLSTGFRLLHATAIAPTGERSRLRRGRASSKVRRSVPFWQQD